MPSHRTPHGRILVYRTARPRFLRRRAALGLFLIAVLVLSLWPDLDWVPHRHRQVRPLPQPRDAHPVASVAMGSRSGRSRSGRSAGSGAGSARAVCGGLHVLMDY